MSGPCLCPKHPHGGPLYDSTGVCRSAKCPVHGCWWLKLEEDFDAIFDDDKTERELSDPRYIEDQLDEEYGS